MGHLYKLEFSNSKTYIGVSTRSPDVRFGEHRLAANDVKASQAVYRAWRKYGEPKMTILAIVKDCDLHLTETKAILAYGTLVPNGYNLTLGGEGATGYKHTGNARAKMAGNSHRLGHKHSEESRLLMSFAHLGNTNASGYKHSENTRIKMSLAHTGVAKPSHSEKMKTFWANMSDEKRAQMRTKSSEAMRNHHLKSKPAINKE